MLRHAGWAKTYEKYDEIVTYFSKYLTTESHHRRMDELSAKLYVGNKGAKAADLLIRIGTGNWFLFRISRGKWSVDVWATWCGPCRKEIPYLIKLEEEMRGQRCCFYRGVRG